MAQDHEQVRPEVARGKDVVDPEALASVRQRLRVEALREDLRQVMG